MAEIKKVLCTAYISEESKAELRTALAPADVEFYIPYGPGAQEKIGAACVSSGCDVAIFNGNYHPAILDNPNIKWIHCCHAGVEKGVKPELFERDIILTTSSGRSAPALAEHVLTFMLALTYDLPGLYRAQQGHKWAATREYSQRTGMFKKTVGILGLGKTGCELARLCKGFEMTVLGYKRSQAAIPNVDRVYASADGDDLKELLARCDYVALTIELNNETWHMIGSEELAVMKPSAYLINLGRGGLVDEPALIEALRAGTIAGAGLDTFESEPLPADSPLWEMPNVLITPHITPKHPDFEKRMMSYVYANLKAYRDGGGFVNRISEKNMFTKG